MSPHELLAQRLRAARLATGRSLRDVATGLGWTHVRLSMLETGNQHVRVVDLLALAGAYGTDPADFLSGLVDT